jgi:hypothetical protein
MLTNEDKEDIIKAYLQDIYDISNKEYQMRVWILGEGPECDDYDENRCRFFDEGDLVLENYKDFWITENQYLILKKFRDRYYAFSRTHSWPPDFIDTPEWDEITKMAAEVLKAFDYKSGADKKKLLKTYLRNICGISNKEHQIQEWVLAEGPECYDYEGIRCRLLDEGDLILKNYKDFGITDSQYQIMKKFRDRYYAFSRAHSWPPEFTDIPEWTEIREIAREVLKAFDYKP